LKDSESESRLGEFPKFQSSGLEAFLRTVQRTGNLPSSCGGGVASWFVRQASVGLCFAYFSLSSSLWNKRRRSRSAEKMMNLEKDIVLAPGYGHLL
jgi:hypothetical protein